MHHSPQGINRASCFPFNSLHLDNEDRTGFSAKCPVADALCHNMKSKDHQRSQNSKGSRRISVLKTPSKHRAARSKKRLLDPFPFGRTRQRGELSHRVGSQSDDRVTRHIRLPSLGRWRETPSGPSEVAQTPGATANPGATHRCL